jgi:hypothetical protein
MSETLYRRVPKVPAEFNAAVELHRKAINAIEYWEYQKTQAALTGRATDEYKTAATAVKQWKRCKADCAAVIQSYQLTLF